MKSNSVRRYGSIVEVEGVVLAELSMEIEQRK